MGRAVQIDFKVSVTRHRLCKISLRNRMQALLDAPNFLPQAEIFGDRVISESSLSFFYRVLTNVPYLFNEESFSEPPMKSCNCRIKSVPFRRDHDIIPRLRLESSLICV
jgi:hypothetical protein